MNFRFALVFMLCATLIASCDKNSKNGSLMDPSQEANLLSEYFSAATVGVVSAADELHYVFNKPLSKHFTPEELSALISLSPAVEGTVTLDNQTILSFKPSTPLRPNTTYTVNLMLKGIDQGQFAKNINYNIKTFKQDMKVERQGILIGREGTVTMIIGVKTADNVSATNILASFQSDADNVEVLEVEDKNYQLEFSFQNGMKSNSYIKYDGNNIYCDVKGKVDMFSYSPDEFGVIYTRHDLANRTYHLYFSDVIDSGTDLTGLIRMNNGTASYNVEGNMVTVFLSEVRNSQSAKLSLEKGIKSIKGNELQSAYTYDISIEADMPAVAFVGEGNYFPSKGDFKIPIKTRALDAIRLMVVEIKQKNVAHYLTWQSLYNSDFSSMRMYGKPVFNERVNLSKGLPDGEGWQVHGIDLNEQIKSNPGSMYFVMMDFTPEDISLTCKEDLAKHDFKSKLPAEDMFYSWESYYRYNYYDYDWDQRRNPCNIAYYVDKYPESKLFICSDYSIIAKKAGQDYHIALANLLDLSPVSDANLTLFDLQAEAIASTTTSSLGFAEFLNSNRDGGVLQVEKDGRTTYLRLNPGESNSLTEFDVTGERNENETEFFVYTERDVWRPGDSIYIDLMINKSNSSLPNGVPAVLSFYNKDNQRIDRQVQTINLDEHSIYSFVLHTNQNAKTGVFRCKIEIGPKTLHKNIRIETIKPNTSEVVFNYNQEEDGTIYTDKISGEINVQYLTGFAVGGAKINTTAKWRKKSNPFPKYRQFVFDVHNGTTSTNFNLFDVVSKENGSASFSNNTSLKFINSPATVSLESELTLPGGGVNKQGNSVSISPFESYVGLHRINGSGWSGNHTFSDDIKIDVVNVSGKGDLLSKQNSISYSLQKHVSHWWIDKYRLRSRGNYTNSSYWKNFKSDKLSINGDGAIVLNKGSLEKGAYKLTCTDDASGHKSEVYFSVYDGFTRIPSSEPYIVDFDVEKEEYSSGESVKIKFPEFDNARALISVERGNKIIDKVWYNLNTDNRELLLNATEDWAPNAYIHVTVMQPYMQDDNDLPLRLYGVKNVTVNSQEFKLLPVANIPEKLESNKDYTFTVSEDEGRPMEYTLALVDEGLLNLTGYGTPNPYRHFQGKFPLLVQTWDIYQWLMRFFKGNFAGIVSIGGDDAYHPDAIPEVNRFESVVMHQGPFKIDRGGKQTHTIRVPNYIGRLRLMVVACSDDNFGNLSKPVPVKNPLMVQSQLPRSLYVTDKMKLPITILKDDASISSAQLKVKTTDGMISGFTPSTTIDLSNLEQTRHTYEVEVLNKTGKLEVDFDIEGGGKSMNEHTEIAVNYPHSFASSEVSQIVEPGQSASLDLTPKGYKEVFNSKIIVSGLKVPNFVKYADELVSYPYGCLEQTVSKGFSQLFLDKVLVLDPEANRARKENLQAVIIKLNRFQRADGKFRYWDNNYYHTWSDIYAGNFLTEMLSQGYLASNSDILKKWLSAQTKIANNWAAAELTSKYAYETESLAQAFRLLVLAKGNKPAKSAMNRFVTNGKSVNPITWWMMAGAFKLSGYDSKAQEFVDKAESLQINYDGNASYASFGGKARDWALIVEVLSLFPEAQNKMDFYYDEMVDAMNGRWINTHTKGFAFSSAYKYFNGNLDISDRISYTINGTSLGGIKNYDHSPIEPNSIIIGADQASGSLQVSNTGKGKIYIYKVDRFIDDQLIKTAENNNLAISTTYYNSTKGNDLPGVSMGDDININVRITNSLAIAQDNLALNVKVPSGFELINPRLYQTTDGTNEKYDYQDFKDDRVYTFFSIPAGKTLNFGFKAKAAFTGDFYQPAISCEHMYKGNVYAHNASQRVVIDE